MDSLNRHCLTCWVRVESNSNRIFATIPVMAVVDGILGKYRGILGRGLLVTGDHALHD